MFDQLRYPLDPVDPAIEVADHIRQTGEKARSNSQAAEQISRLQAFGLAVKQLRLARGWSRAQASQQSQLPKQEIAWVEWGLMSAADTRMRLAALAAGCGTSESYLQRVYQAILSEGAEPITASEEILA